jgi:hypothetical protein
MRLPEKAAMVAFQLSAKNLSHLAGQMAVMVDAVAMSFWSLIQM